MQYFYLSRVHSDAAVSYVVANAIIDTGKLFPHDFWFGNDIFLLRPQFILALLLKFGLTGYQAYSIACALTVGVCVATVAMAGRWLGFSLRRSIVLTALTFIPLGYTEFDFLLGQQSHLVQTALSLVFIFAAIGSRDDSKRVPLTIVSCLTLGMITADSAPRGVLLFSAYVISATMYGRNLRTGLKLHTLLFLFMTAGFAANYLISQNIHKVGIGGTLRFSSALVSVEKIGDLVDAFFSRFGDLRIFNRSNLSFADQVSYAAKFLWCSLLIYQLFRSAYSALWPKSDDDCKAIDQISITGSILVLAGAVIVCTFQFETDPRHFLTGLIYLKYALFASLMERATKLGVARAYIQIVLVLTVLLASTPIIAFSTPALRDVEAREAAVRISEAEKLKQAAKSISSVHPVVLFGEYWTTTVFELLTDSSVVSAPLAVWVGEIEPTRWLARPSNYCNQATALAIFTSKDQILKEVLSKKTRLTFLYQFNGNSIFKIEGKAISSCPNQ